jgi:hypothetical protein
MLNFGERGFLLHTKDQGVYISRACGIYTLIPLLFWIVASHQWNSWAFCLTVSSCRNHTWDCWAWNLNVHRTFWKFYLKVLGLQTVMLRLYHTLTGFKIYFISFVYVCATDSTLSVIKVQLHWASIVQHVPTCYLQCVAHCCPMPHATNLKYCRKWEAAHCCKASQMKWEVNGWCMQQYVVTSIN